MGPVCPHCGATGEDVTKLEGKAHRAGLYQCSQCREQFTVTVKTVFERSKIPLIEMAGRPIPTYRLEKGHFRPSGASLARHFVQNGVVHDAPACAKLCATGGLLPPMGDGGEPVEADETYIGSAKEQADRTDAPFGPHKHAVLTSLTAAPGKPAASMWTSAASEEIAPIVRANISTRGAPDDRPRRLGTRSLGPNLPATKPSIISQGRIRAWRREHEHCGKLLLSV